MAAQETDRVVSMARPNPRDFVQNWTRSTLPMHKKVAQAMKNNAIKLKNGSNCCGNHGEVGC